MIKRLSYLCTFIILLLIEILIGKFATGFVRAYVGDVLVMPAMYYALRIIFPKDGIFTSYILGGLVYLCGWLAEFLQSLNLCELIGVDSNSLLGILIGSTFDWNDIFSYSVGMILIVCIQILLKQIYIKNYSNTNNIK